eukprot:TRINITY_DN3554_c0_g1_i1.p1 TRINITY_DN3554_c0_g1~~TRINITY_DN3554_c0_g1_i1.p1  ORF type:complete len:610 (+),score=128.14 TRINITY_DN3554_c0_g1_i1:59-1888(+)
MDLLQRLSKRSVVASVCVRSFSNDSAKNVAQWYNRVPRRDGILRLLRQTLYNSKDNNPPQWQQQTMRNESLRNTVESDATTKNQKTVNASIHAMDGNTKEFVDDVTKTKETCKQIALLKASKAWDQIPSALDAYLNTLSADGRTRYPLILAPFHQSLQISLHHDQPFITQHTIDAMIKNSLPILPIASRYAAESFAKVREMKWTMSLWKSIQTQSMDQHQLHRAMTSVLKAALHAEDEELIHEIMTHTMQTKTGIQYGEFFRTLIDYADDLEEFGCSYGQLLAFLDKVGGWERNPKVLESLGSLPDSQHKLVALFKLLDKKKKEGHFNPDYWPFNQLIVTSYRVGAQSAAIHIAEQMKKYHLTPSGTALSIVVELSYKSKPSSFSFFADSCRGLQSKASYRLGLCKGLLSHPLRSAADHLVSISLMHPNTSLPYRAELYEIQALCLSHRYDGAFNIFRSILQKRVYRPHTAKPSQQSMRRKYLADNDHSQQQIERALAVFAESITTPEGRRSFFSALQLFAQSGLRPSHQGRLYHAILASQEWLFEAYGPIMSPDIKAQASDALQRVVVDTLFNVLYRAKDPSFVAEQIKQLSLCRNPNQATQPTKKHI